MRKRLLFLSILFCLFSCQLIFANEDTSFENIENLRLKTQLLEVEINLLKAQILEQSASTKKVMLGTVLLEDDEISDWKICNLKLENICNDEAHLFFEGKRLISFHIRLGTPTEDWGEHRYYCYREDESLAFISYEYWTFCEGSIKIEAQLYFNQNGKKVSEIVKFFDIETNKEIKESMELYESPEIYLKTSDALRKFSKDLKGVVPPWTTFK